MIEDNIQSNTINLILQTITPLHIGNDEKLTSVGEFITTIEKIRYLNLDAINDFLKKQDLTDEYVEQILNSSEDFDTYKVLTRIGFNVEENINKEMLLHHKNLNPLNNNILHIFYNSNGRIYIPGSSVKGMLKTVLLFHYLDNDRSYLEHIEKTINERINNWNKKQLFEWLKKTWEEASKIDKLFEKKEFNYLRPFDSLFVTDTNLQAEQVKRQHLYGVETTGLDWLVETIKPEVTIPFRMQIIPSFGAKYYELNQPGTGYLFKLINDYSLKMIDYEIALLGTSVYENKEYLIQSLNTLKGLICNSNNEFAIARMGKGKTIYYNTIWSLLNKEVLRKITHRLKKEDDTSDYFPKTRILTAYDEMMGWIKLSEQTPDYIDNKVYCIQQ